MDQEGETPVFRSDAIRRASVNPYDGKDEEQSATTINTTNVVQLRSAGAETRYRTSRNDHQELANFCLRQDQSRDNGRMYRKAALLVGFLAAMAWVRAPLAGQDQPVTPLGIALESYPYPHPVHFLNFEMQGQPVRMAYMDVPAIVSTNGETVLLLHGKNFGSYYWEGTIKALTSAGYRVVATGRTECESSNGDWSLDRRYVSREIHTNVSGAGDEAGGRRPHRS
jgi:hypothetical protein